MKGRRRGVRGAHCRFALAQATAWPTPPKRLLARERRRAGDVAADPDRTLRAGSRQLRALPFLPHRNVGGRVDSGGWTWTSRDINPKYLDAGVRWGIVS